MASKQMILDDDPDGQELMHILCIRKAGGIRNIKKRYLDCTIYGRLNLLYIKKEIPK